MQMHADQDCRNYHDKVVDWRGQPPAGVMTLCGSTKFKQQFEDANKRFTLEGWIVLSVGHYPHQELDFDWCHKGNLDELHKRKIDLSDAIFVLNVGGYIGESTKSEIVYARSHGKIVMYLEPQNA